MAYANFNEALMELKRKATLSGRPVSKQEVAGITEGIARVAPERLIRIKQVELQEKAFPDKGKKPREILTGEYTPEQRTAAIPDKPMPASEIAMFRGGIANFDKRNKSKVEDALKPMISWVERMSSQGGRKYDIYKGAKLMLGQKAPLINEKLQIEINKAIENGDDALVEELGGLMDSIANGSFIDNVMPACAARATEERERAIYTDIYNQPVISQAPKPSLLQYGKELFQKKRPTIGRPLTQADIEAFKPAVKVKKTDQSLLDKFLCISYNIGKITQPLTSPLLTIAQPHIRKFLRLKTIDRIEKHPEFQALDLASKGEVYLNFFNRRMSDYEFKALPKKTQRKVKIDFLRSRGIDEHKARLIIIIDELTDAAYKIKEPSSPK